MLAALITKYNLQNIILVHTSQRELYEELWFSLSAQIIGRNYTSISILFAVAKLIKIMLFAN